MHSRPASLQLIALFSSLMMASVWPLEGLLYTKLTFALFESDDIMGGIKKYVYLLLGLSVAAFLFAFLQKSLFGIIGENITLAVRSQLYESLMKKHIGWFDLPDNNPGALTSVLSGEVQQLNGVSSEAIGSNIEMTLSLFIALGIAFGYSWRMALVALGMTPFLLFGNMMNAKFQSGVIVTSEENFKEANKIVSDALVNAKTVASFGHEELIIQNYHSRLEANRERAARQAHVSAIIFGFS